MPQDANNKELELGDEVMIPCKVVRIDDNYDYCNVTIETKHAMPPYTDGSRYSLNSKQLEKL